MIANRLANRKTPTLLSILGFEKAPFEGIFSLSVKGYWHRVQASDERKLTRPHCGHLLLIIESGHLFGMEWIPGVFKCNKPETLFVHRSSKI